jgi:hypothetical protein
MKKLNALSDFESKKIDSSACKLANGGNTNWQTTTRTAASYGCTESSTTTHTDTSGGFCEVTEITERCPC